MKPAAIAAEESFVRLFQQRDTPDKMLVYKLLVGQTIAEVLLACGLARTKNEARRLIDQKGVRLDGEIMVDAQAVFPHGGVLQIGKRRFVRVS